MLNNAYLKITLNITGGSIGGIIGDYNGGGIIEANTATIDLDINGGEWTAGLICNQNT